MDASQNEEGVNFFILHLLLHSAILSQHYTLEFCRRSICLRKERVQVDIDTNEILIFFFPSHMAFIYANVTFVNKRRICKSQEDQTSHKELQNPQGVAR